MSDVIEERNAAWYDLYAPYVFQISPKSPERYSSFYVSLTEDAEPFSSQQIY
ncbi:hypothetical protein [Acinetobacter gyllenbergii]|uniref:hypothetical protein n=1 Tax=Acinetobacter gyllenbergii TaxID=134534 RepID=UPI003F56BC92